MQELSATSRRRAAAKRVGIALVVLAAGAAALLWSLRRDGAARVYTGFVEGEERVVRSEVTGRVVDMQHGEGAAVEANAVLAMLDARDIEARIKAKREEIAVLDVNIRTQEERVQLVESTWRRDLSARRADLQQAESAADLAVRTFKREHELVATGASTAQQLDDARAGRDQAQSAVERARQMLARTEAEERSISVARHELDALRQQRDLAEAQLAELQVTQSKYVVRAPAVPTVVQKQFIWPGELAQPGSAIVSVLDPKDKYVQIYVPVADLDKLHIGQRVEIELDSRLGHRVPGEISFIAAKANFTPEKIETRADRLGQVYRAKVRILEGVEDFQPGTEGNVYLADGARR